MSQILKATPQVNKSKNAIAENKYSEESKDELRQKQQQVTITPEKKSKSKVISSSVDKEMEQLDEIKSSEKKKEKQKSSSKSQKMRDEEIEEPKVIKKIDLGESKMLTAAVDGGNEAIRDDSKLALKSAFKSVPTYT